MHGVTKPIVLGVAALFGAGLISVAAANSHGEAVSDLARASKALIGEARGDAVSIVASATGEARSDKAKADAKADKAARTTDKAADKSAKTTGDAHGDAVSAVARNDEATAAHTTGAKKVNHGGAVSVAAHSGK